MDRLCAIVEKFLSADGFVSGQELSAELGVSRAALWQNIKALEAEGFAFEAVRKLGYRLRACPARISPSCFGAMLNAENARMPHFFFESTTSTNSQAFELLESGARAPFAVAAMRQVCGRAKNGGQWRPSKNSFALSVGFAPLGKFPAPERLAKKIAANVAAMLRRDFGAEVRASGNAVFAGSKKICGVLCETLSEGAFVRAAVAGVGLECAGFGRAFNQNIAAAKIISLIKNAVGARNRA